MFSWLDRSARERRVPKRLVWAAVIAPLAGLAVVIGIRIVNMAAFRFVMEEDGLVEWLQFFCFLGATIVAALIAAHRWRAGHVTQAALYAFVALALFFVSGEEIAWGTRLLAMETPEWLREINLQEEVTIHNIAGVLFWFNMVLLVTSLYAIVADPLNWRFRIAERWPHGRALFVPPLFLFTAFGVMASLRLMRLITGTPSQYTVTKLIEWAELCYAAAVLAVVWLAYRELRAADAADAATQGPLPSTDPPPSGSGAAG